MRILQITKKFPYPSIDGEVIAINGLTKGFAQLGHQVTVLALNTKKHYFDISKLPQAQAKLAHYMAVDIDTSLSVMDAALNLFSSKSYNVERFYSRAFEDKIAKITSGQQFDFILLEGVYLMRYIDVIRKSTKAKVILRPHNVEYVIWQRLHENETNPIKKAYLKLLAGRMKKFELDNICRADLLAPVSETDMTIFRAEGCHTPYRTFPIGYDFDALPAFGNDEENAVSFIGAMDWMPNREGVEWFIAKVWPLVLQQIPAAKFYLAGRNFPAEIMSLKAEGIIVVGEVPDAKQFISSKSISVVPLFAGSGMRVKIIEAMALGRAIVSTSVGAESIEYADGKDILIADNATTFAHAIISVMNNKQLRLNLGNGAQHLVNHTYDNRKICSAIIDFCKPYL
ncbi:MAG TPA: glycosyltransferase family 4 protein [Chitinophagales bacterium]|nr:glycosyltransferase family 4 protein [Chitinophagales bacterium]